MLEMAGPAGKAGSRQRYERWCAGSPDPYEEGAEMQRTKMSMIAVAGAAVVVSTMAATAAEASPMVTHTVTHTATDTATDTAMEHVPGGVGDKQATAYGTISKAGLKPGMSATTHPVACEILYVE